MKIEIAVSNDQESAVIEAITSSAKTENIGDGKIFVMDLEGAIRIRTGETGDEAL